MPRPRVLLIDDGELDDVLELLRGLDIEPIRAADPGPAQEGEERADLLVASASTALALWPRWSAPDSAAVTIAITQSESKTLCASLRRLGFDYLVRRPVHPEALRLLLHSSLYRSDDRRGAARLPAGCEVTWFEGWQRRSGTLLELSSGGCRLIPKRRIAPRSVLSITLPRSVAGWPWLRLKGRVTRTVRDDSRHGMLSVAVLFGDLSSRTRLRLDALLEELRLGPVALSDASPAQDAETVSSSVRRTGRVTSCAAVNAGATSPRSHRRRTRARLMAGSSPPRARSGCAENLRFGYRRCASTARRSPSSSGPRR